MEPTVHLETEQIIDNNSQQQVVILLCDLFDDFIACLSDKKSWKNIFLFTDAQKIIDNYIQCIPLINGKNKGALVIDVISKNCEIKSPLKTELMSYMKQLGMTYNKNEMLFENLSKLSRLNATV